MVASDGHSYERSAILLVINGVNRVSPLTRERLRPNVLIPNLNLKKRMLAFEEDLLRAAAIAVANATDGAQQQGSDEGPVSSRAPPPTGRRREHEALHKKAQSLQQQVQHAESRLKQQQRDASAAQGRLLAELDDMSRSRSQQLAAARGVAAELHGQLEQKKESHARELRSLREELKELSGAKRPLEADAGMAGGAAAAEGAEGASGGAAGDERRQGGARKRPKLEKRDRELERRDRTSGASDRSSASGSKVGDPRWAEAPSDGVEAECSGGSEPGAAAHSAVAHRPRGGKGAAAAGACAELRGAVAPR